MAQCVLPPIECVRFRLRAIAYTCHIDIVPFVQLYFGRIVTAVVLRGSRVRVGCGVCGGAVRRAARRVWGMHADAACGERARRRDEC